MKTKSFMKFKVIAVCWIVFVVAAASVSAEVRYAVTPLGVVQPEGVFYLSDPPGPKELNDKGQVVGYRAELLANGQQREHGFIYDNGVFADIEGLDRALDIDDAGRVVGVGYSSDDFLQTGYLYENGSLVDITAPCQQAWAKSISPDGAYIGGYCDREAFIFHEGLFTKFSFGGGFGDIRAINNQGVGTGASARLGSSNEAFRYQDGVMLGFGSPLSMGLDINEAGQIVGFRTVDEQGTWHAFIEEGGGVVDLGTLGGPGSIAQGNNNEGIIVGRSDVLLPSGMVARHGFILENGIMKDLNDLLEIGSTWEIVNAAAVNNRGQIVASGYNKENPGDKYALLLTPCPGPGCNNPPVLDSIGNKTVGEGALLEFTVTATDPNDGDVLTLSGSNLPPGASFDATTGIFSWTPGYDQAGNYENVEFSVIDNGDPVEVDVELITITVGDVNRAPVFVAIAPKDVLEDQILTFAVQATDPDGDNVGYTAESLPFGANFDATTQMFSWTPDFTQEGNYTVSFVATDDGVPNLSTNAQVLITVGDVPTAPELADTLVDIVTSGDLGLPQEVENAYMANLKKLQIFLEESKVTPAVNQLEAFIHKVEQDMAHATISTEEGNILIALANDLIALLSQ